MNYFSFRKRSAWVYVVLSILSYGLSEIFYLTKALKQVAPINQHRSKWGIHLVAVLMWGVSIASIFYEDYIQSIGTANMALSPFLQEVLYQIRLQLLLFLLAISVTIQTVMKVQADDEYSEKADAVSRPLGHGGIGRLISIIFVHKQGMTDKTIWSYLMFLGVFLNMLGLPPYVSVWLQNIH